jgi:hypothetical protein
MKRSTTPEENTKAAETQKHAVNPTKTEFGSKKE